MNIVAALQKGLNVRTAKGLPVRFIGLIKGKGVPYPLIIGIESMSGEYKMENYDLNGKHITGHESPMDLQVKGWL